MISFEKQRAVYCLRIRHVSGGKTKWIRITYSPTRESLESISQEWMSIPIEERHQRIEELLAQRVADKEAERQHRQSPEGIQERRERVREAQRRCIEKLAEAGLAPTLKKTQAMLDRLLANEERIAQRELDLELRRQQKALEKQQADLLREQEKAARVAVRTAKYEQIRAEKEQRRQQTTIERQQARELRKLERASRPPRIILAERPHARIHQDPEKAERTRIEKEQKRAAYAARQEQFRLQREEKANAKKIRQAEREAKSNALELRKAEEYRQRELEREATRLLKAARKSIKVSKADERPVKVSPVPVTKEPKSAKSNPTHLYNSELGVEPNNITAKDHFPFIFDRSWIIGTDHAIQNKKTIGENADYTTGIETDGKVRMKFRRYRLNINEFLSTVRPPAYTELPILNPWLHFQTSGEAVRKAKQLLSDLREYYAAIAAMEESPKLLEFKLQLDEAVAGAGRLLEHLLGVRGKYVWAETEIEDGRVIVIPKNPRSQEITDVAAA